MRMMSKSSEKMEINRQAMVEELMPEILEKELLEDGYAPINKEKKKLKVYLGQGNWVNKSAILQEKAMALKKEMYGDKIGDARKNLYGSFGYEYDRMMEKKGFEVSNGLRAAVLMTGLFRHERKDGAGRKVMQYMLSSLKIPKATYFLAVLLLESCRRLSSPPTKGKQRFVHNRDFLDALDYNRIIRRAEGESEKVLNEWAQLYESKGDTK